MPQFNTHGVKAINRAIESVDVTPRPDMFSDIDGIWYIKSFQGEGGICGLKLHDDASDSFVLIVSRGEGDAKYLGAHINNLTGHPLPVVDVCDAIARFPVADNGPGQVPFATYKDGVTYKSVMTSCAAVLTAGGCDTDAQKALDLAARVEQNTARPAIKTPAEAASPVFVSMSADCVDTDGGLKYMTAVLKFNSMAHYHKCDGDGFDDATAVAFDSTLPAGWSMDGSPEPGDFLLRTAKVEQDAVEVKE